MPQPSEALALLHRAGYTLARAGLRLDEMNCVENTRPAEGVWKCYPPLEVVEWQEAMSWITDTKTVLERAGFVVEARVDLPETAGLYLFGGPF